MVQEAEGRGDGGGGIRTPKGVAARRISSAVPYQLELRLQQLLRTRVVCGSYQSGRQDLNLRPLRPERSALPG